MEWTIHDVGHLLLDKLVGNGMRGALITRLDRLEVDTLLRPPTG
jgi:hypothetical protein